MCRDDSASLLLPRIDFHTASQLFLCKFTPSGCKWHVLMLTVYPVELFHARIDWIIFQVGFQ